MKLKITLIFSAAFLLMLIISIIRLNYTLNTTSLIGFAGFFGLTFFCFQNLKLLIPDWKILMVLAIGASFFQIPVRIMFFWETLGTLPDFLFQLLGIIGGYFIWRLKSPLNILTTLFICLIPLFMFHKGYDYWFHKLNYETFNGRIESYKPPAKFEAFDEQRNLISDNNFQNKIVLLDFWHTRCG